MRSILVLPPFHRQASRGPSIPRGHRGCTAALSRSHSLPFLPFATRCYYPLRTHHPSPIETKPTSPSPYTHVKQQRHYALRPSGHTPALPTTLLIMPSQGRHIGITPPHAAADRPNSFPINQGSAYLPERHGRATTALCKMISRDRVLSEVLSEVH